MPPKSRSPTWLKALIEFLDRQGNRVFSRSEISALLARERTRLGIPKSRTESNMIQALRDDGKLRLVLLRREEKRSGAGAKKRFVWGTPSDYAVGLSLAKGAYLSHASAVFLHALTEQLPKTIYVNKEQTPKPPPRGAFSQPAIDRAFQNAPRTSNYVFVSDTARFVLLSGKHTGALGVSEIRGPNGDRLRTTSLERTLIDIVVRPTYAGGVFEVLAAYLAAARRLSVGALLGTLRKLGHAYPYHQSIGFLLERAGFSETQLEGFAQLGIRWDFYLDYQMKDPAYHPRWRLYHPKGL